MAVKEKAHVKGKKLKRTIMEYEDKQCLICQTPYATMLLIGMVSYEFCLCKSCASEVKERLEKWSFE